MIKYHGTPLTPIRIFKSALTNRNCLIPFGRNEDFKRAKEMCSKIMIDNSAFSMWTKGIIVDWNEYYKWVEEIYDDIEHFIVPDVIDGTEEENDELINNFFSKVKKLRYKFDFTLKAIPVWHIAESFERLERLMNNFDYIAFGSSGEYSELGTYEWHKRMNETMKVVCDENGKPKVKIHMLRCLNPKIFTQYPFYSGDSTNLARNHSKRGWQNILKGIEPYFSPSQYKFKTFYETGCLFESVGA